MRALTTYACPTAGASGGPLAIRRPALPPALSKLASSSPRHPEMRVGRGAVGTVGRQHVLRTGGEDDDEIALGAQGDRLVGPAHRRAVVDVAIGDDRRVLEEIERARRLGRRKAERAERGGEIVGAVVVIVPGAELRVAIAVAGGDQRVVNPRRGV